MSKPTPHDELYRWHRNALLGVYGEPTTEFNENPECGFFKRRLVKDGPFVPARIWMHQPTDPETGDLVGDETLQCEVDGQFADAEQQWSWLNGNPITEAEFNYLTELRRWSEQHAPDEPYANPRQPTDWLRVPTPQFTTKEPTP